MILALGLAVLMNGGSYWFSDKIVLRMYEAQLEGVLAHELAHIKNRDLLLSPVVAPLAGAITLVAGMARWAALFGD